MKKVIITGATGQDGSNMIDYLLNNTEHEIYAIAPKNVFATKPRLHYTPISLLQQSCINDLFEELKDSVMKTIENTKHYPKLKIK